MSGRRRWDDGDEWEEWRRVGGENEKGGMMEMSGRSGGEWEERRRRVG